MTFLTQYKNVLFALCGIVILFLIYVQFFGGGGGGGGGEETLLSSEDVSSPIVGQNQDLIALLLELKSISLDKEIFSSAVFKSLTDFGLPLSPEPIGHPNPFDPLPGSRAAASP